MADQAQPGATPPAPQNDMVCLADGSVAQRINVDYKAIGADQAAADFNAAVGRGWKFDDAEMGAFLKSLDSDVENLNKAILDSEPLNQIKPMGNEIASHQSTDVMNGSGALAQGTTLGALTFLTAYTEHLHQVQTAYLNSDQSALAALRSAGKDA